MGARDRAVDMAADDLRHVAMPRDQVMKRLPVAQLQIIHRAKAHVMRRVVHEDHHAPRRLGQLPVKPVHPRLAKPTAMAGGIVIGRGKERIEKDQPRVAHVLHALHKTQIVQHIRTEHRREIFPVVMIADHQPHRHMGVREPRLEPRVGRGIALVRQITGQHQDLGFGHGLRGVGQTGGQPCVRVGTLGRHIGCIVQVGQNKDRPHGYRPLIHVTKSVTVSLVALGDRISPAIT